MAPRTSYDPVDIDPATVTGNLTTYDKKFNIVMVTGKMKYFAYDEARLLKLTEVWVKETGPHASDCGEWTDERKRALKARNASKASPISLEGITVFEVTVNERMVNLPGFLAGGCAMHFMDIGSISALDALATVTGDPILGYSTSMDLVWHGAAAIGETLRVVSTTLSVGKRVKSAMSHIYNKNTGQLLVSGIHVVSPVASLSHKLLEQIHEVTRSKL